ncbi:hypothetical protein LMANV2_170033 [Leptospira interrogans serovar Manilae]|uniref:Uncharacterized protein n=1 Tax=Leptospira interrogans serovar Manilae TaxID=214675 RepID=A0AAQ1NXL8_LEPIR|nr:hypothetical protein LMANV2_170033 [Leptospira interrogans serovar Manilae]
MGEPDLPQADGPELSVLVNEFHTGNMIHHTIFSFSIERDS